jgi:hypothetical protein
MDALKKASPARCWHPRIKKLHKARVGQKEMLLPIEGKKPAAKKAAKPSGRHVGRPAKNYCLRETVYNFDASPQISQFRLFNVLN